MYAKAKIDRVRMDQVMGRKSCDECRICDHCQAIGICQHCSGDCPIKKNYLEAVRRRGHRYT